MGGNVIDGVPLHARDHLPDGPDPIDFPDAQAPNLAMAYIDYAGETVTTGGWKNISQDTPDPIEINSGYTNPAAEEVIPGQSGGNQHLRVDTLTDGGGTTYGIYVATGGVAAEPNRHGIYAITGSIEWDGTAFDGYVGLEIILAGMLPWNYGVVDLRDANTFGLTGSNFQGRFQSKTIVTVIQGSGTGQFVKLAAYHNQGSDYDFLEAGLIVKQIGWWSSAEGTFFP